MCLNTQCYLDKENFGRFSYDFNKNELFDLIYNQVFYFQQLCTLRIAYSLAISSHTAKYYVFKQYQDFLTMAPVFSLDLAKLAQNSRMPTLDLS